MHRPPRREISLCYCSGDDMVLVQRQDTTLKESRLGFGHSVCMHDMAFLGGNIHVSLFIDSGHICRQGDMYKR